MALLVTLSRLAAPFEPVENTAIADAREAPPSPPWPS
jgi:hypothetical protein